MSSGTDDSNNFLYGYPLLSNMIEFTSQTLIYFILGCIGASIPKFLEVYHKKKKRKTKVTKKIVFLEGFYILLGGIFAVILEPSNELHALIFGATWESVIIAYIARREKDGK